MHVCVREYVLYVSISARVCMHVCIYGMCARVCIACVCAREYACMYICVRASMHACIYACVREYVLYVCVSARVCVYL